MGKLSVIIPAYNASRNLRQCIDSIINQTYRDLEIILVDDCSSDETFDIMNEYVEKDKRVIAIRNLVNGGAGKSRNEGMRLATGDYVTFVDSDDFLDLNTYQAVIDAIKDNDSPDVIRFNQNSFLDCGNLKINIDFFTNNIFNNYSCVFNPRFNPKYVALESPGVCNKVFKRSLIDDTEFVEGKKWEDYPFCTFLLGKAEKVVLIDKGRYNYRHSLKADNTTLGDVKKPTSRILEIFDCCDILEQEYKDEGLWDIYQDAIRGNQKVQALQRVRDIMFTKSYSTEEKKKIVNALINLVEQKYGSVFDDDIYLTLKGKKMFYNTRMTFVEKVYCDDASRKDSSEEVIKEKIRKLI